MGQDRFRDETAQRLPEQDEGAGWPQGIRLADMNGDGRLDFGVVVNSTASERAPLYLDDGGGTYHPVPMQSSRTWFVFTDTNGDRQTDVASASAVNNTEFVDVQLQLVVPAAPSGIRAAPIRGAIRVSWRQAPNADRYEVWRSSPGVVRRLIGTTPMSRFDDRKARRGVRYMYVARSVSPAGKSPFSTRATTRRP